MADFSPEELESLKDWARDARGAPYWTTVREMFAEGVRHLRAHGRSGDATQAARQAGHIDTLEEILDLPALIIQQHAEKEKTDAEA